MYFKLLELKKWQAAQAAKRKKPLMLPQDQLAKELAELKETPLPKLRRRALMDANLKRFRMNIARLEQGRIFRDLANIHKRKNRKYKDWKYGKWIKTHWARGDNCRWLH
jgi:hypothetical protein